jgi:hypothetical protein
MPSNQKTATAVVNALRRSEGLRHYQIDVIVREGLVELAGSVANPTQKQQVLTTVQAVEGVTRVVDRLQMLAPNPITQVQARDYPPAPMPGLEPRVPEQGSAPLPEPVPIFAAPPPAPFDLNPPRMPPYAWPTYAPYNNLSRVAYPLAYPYQSWPFIGPCYPFPKVPLGWRSVKLEWEDGRWWFSKTATKYDWWHLRYW